MTLERRVVLFHSASDLRAIELLDRREIPYARYVAWKTLEEWFPVPFIHTPDGESYFGMDGIEYWLEQRGSA